MSHDVLASPFPSEEIPQPHASRLCRLVRPILTIIAWYCISSIIVLLTKWLFTNHFSYPLTVTTYSNTVASLWALLVSCHPRFRPDTITREQFFNYILPLGLCTGLEIGCSNLALKMLTVSFGTILKGGGPIFTFLWGLFFRVEVFSPGVCISLTTIAFGIALASMGEGQEFDWLGLVLQLMASALGGFRWAMTHVLLKDKTSPLSPNTATLYTSPTTALVVLPFALALEGPSVWNHDFSSGDFSIVMITMTSIASLVFLLLVSEYWLVHATSSLAVSVAAIFKELLTIGGGVLFFADHISALNEIGFTICQMGMVYYIYLRYDSSSRDEYTEANQDESATRAKELELQHTDTESMPEITWMSKREKTENKRERKKGVVTESIHPCKT